PDRYRRSEHVFLGNIDPVLQRQVLDQVDRPKVVACDTMNFWITGKPEELRKTLAVVAGLLINDGVEPPALGEWKCGEGTLLVAHRRPTPSRPDIDARYRLFKRLTHFEEV